ncbi:MAG TPA: right-handed parallel beta-helix repeat-containing protein [Prolixibacteraceae bacterium]|nr:right-handed parallel beta-helix repeat-containing protein [Prolixibacteraceae bacterium]
MKNYFVAGNLDFKLGAFLLIIILASCMNGQATNYYISSTGIDTNNGLTPSTSWLTISKVNAHFSSMAPGDSILFKRGDTFYGSIVVSKSGTIDKPIVISAYGTGSQPVITGFSKATGWKSVGNNLWESDAIIEANKPNMVLSNGKPIAIGRYPNNEYLTFENSSGNTSISDHQLSGSPDWTGGEVIIRKNHWTISRDVITNHNGTTISYAGTSGYNSTNGYGYFIQNHLSTLDIQNEWCFNPNTKRITVYSGTVPANIKVSSRDVLLNIGQCNFLCVDNISLEGANVAGINGGHSKGNQVKNCTIHYSGKDAIYFKNSAHCFVEKNKINHSYNNAVMFAEKGGYSDGNTIRYNHISNTGTVPGMNSHGASNTGIYVDGANALIEYNVVDTTGYIGIAYYRDDSKVRNNIVRYFCFIKDDGAGIYTWTSFNGSITNKGREVIGNMVSHGIGAGAGTLDGKPSVMGIYIDDGSRGVSVEDNTVCNMDNGCGIYLHNCQDITVQRNTVFNCKLTQLLIVHDKHSPNIPIRNIILRDNKFVAKEMEAELVTIRTKLDDLGSFCSVSNGFDNNTYYKPIDDNCAKFKTTKIVRENYVHKNYTLNEWKAAFPAYEVNSGLVSAIFDAKMTANNFDDYLRFEYNETSQPKIISLNGNSYKTLENIVQSGTYTIPAFGSVILLKCESQ